MAEPHHKMTARNVCDVKGCDEEAERSINVKRAEAAGLKISDVEGGSAHLCKQHYREFKKKSKKDRDLERLGW
jgi:hypothetical protein